jgi:hypothetical protein
VTLDLRDCTFYGPALPEPYVKFQLEAELLKRKLLPKAAGADGRDLQDRWDVYRRKLRALGEQGGERRVAGHVFEPLAGPLGYARIEREQEPIVTREGPEDGGWLFTSGNGTSLRAWAVGLGTDMDAPSRRGRAYRYSPNRVAQRVLLAQSERVGLLTDGEELRLLLCDPARPDSHVAIHLDRSGGWRSARSAPDSYRLLLALASPGGVAALPVITDAARLAQSGVTKKLRRQARRAVESFVQELLDHPENAGARASWSDPAEKARALWREGLVLIYRLLFVLKLESAADPARAFSFKDTSLWRNTYSPNTALAALARKVLDQGAGTGGFLEHSLRTLWRLFAEGLSSSELEVRALGGMLFGKGTTPLVDELHWGERAVARLLDALLWTPSDGKAERERVHYGALDVEDLGRVYEALLELEPGITAEPMCRLKRAKLEVVVPAAQGAPYQTDVASEEDEEQDEDDVREEDGEDEEPGRRGKKTRVQFVEEIPPGRFFLRVGLGRKASGSYYTPHAFVRFLVQETLGPQLAERSPKDDPRPDRILSLKVLDPAMGSGHFLVEACRYVGDALYEACRLCDELAVQAEEKAVKVSGGERVDLLARAVALRRRVEELPDPDDELVAYLPSRAVEGSESGLSQKKAAALCRRLVAVHCLYGVDKNPLAVELAKLSLWLESYAEGLPLTFLDHRLVCGDSLAGPFFKHLLTYPGSGKRLGDVFAQDLAQRLQACLGDALVHVRDLEATVGKNVADLEQKRAAKERLDTAFAPLKLLSAAWSGGVMLGEHCDDIAYRNLAEAVAGGEDVGDTLKTQPRLRDMAARGRRGVAYELVFPEVFYPDGAARQGFDAVLGNPPWDAIQFKSKEFLAAFDLSILDAPTKRERTAIEERLLADQAISGLFLEHQQEFEQTKRSNDRLFDYQKVMIDGDLAGRQLDSFRVFMERNAQLLRQGGFAGVVVPSAFHANAGATGVRQLYLEKMALKCCFSFENRKQLFDIHRSFKFATVVAQNDPSGTYEFECGFYLHDVEWLFARDAALRYSRDFVLRTGKEHLTFLEAANHKYYDILAAIVPRTISTGDWCQASGLAFFTAEMHMSHDAHRFTRLSRYGSRFDHDTIMGLWREQVLPLYEGKSFFQFEPSLQGGARYGIPLSRLQDKAAWLRSLGHFRLAYRNISASTNERTMVSVVLPPLAVTSEKAPSEKTPWLRANLVALVTVGVWNSFPFDFCLRPRVASTVNAFILKSSFFPRLDGRQQGAIAHTALRLSCSNPGYEALWLEQLGGAWREQVRKHEWPVLQSMDAVSTARAVIDAVIADAYGLTALQYAELLSTFSHKSWPDAPARCLEAFHELKAIGIAAFIEKHDPYWDIPLNESLPTPAIDLPILGEGESEDRHFGPLFLQHDRAVRQAHPYEAASVARVSKETDAAAYEKIRELLARRGTISSVDAQEATGLDAAGVRPYLRQLVREGRADIQGQRRGLKYKHVPEER